MKPRIAFLSVGLLLALSKAAVVVQANGTDFSVADEGISLFGGNWKLQNATLVDATPETISQADFDDSHWMPAVVPGTVLTSYLAIGAIPNPWYGDQLSRISDGFFSTKTFGIAVIL